MGYRETLARRRSLQAGARRIIAQELRGLEPFQVGEKPSLGTDRRVTRKMGGEERDAGLVARRHEPWDHFARGHAEAVQILRTERMSDQNSRYGMRAPSLNAAGACGCLRAWRAMWG